ncbi:hypothetical protein C5B42_06000 [Candidatus Cerribacteria bacterium 'Amazon FNV 2010 28 9']|uniref:Uncharacterized protein n=1 Tax=Candidatus Cerribacteria bacterium 'Amazon FNV 2010 28 9' TaxID=2081795 RepID=A0A317JLL0_9BACT|nr:MAG: hypothetical protein C5B42_06000 [Candidatus Cerribacteria bacterium 'Amazon FNV 2010 28 9']
MVEKLITVRFKNTKSVVGVFPQFVHELTKRPEFIALFEGRGSFSDINNNTIVFKIDDESLGVDEFILWLRSLSYLIVAGIDDIEKM